MKKENNNIKTKNNLSESKLDKLLQLQKKLGKRIRQLRKAIGYSQESFAFECGLHRTYVGCIERGEKNITVSNLEKVAKTLNIGMEELFKDL